MKYIYSKTKRIGTTYKAQNIEYTLNAQAVTGGGEAGVIDVGRGPPDPEAELRDEPPDRAGPWGFGFRVNSPTKSQRLLLLLYSQKVTRWLSDESTATLDLVNVVSGGC